jgi:transcriptional regulator of nitric oxide reductase
MTHWQQQGRGIVAATILFLLGATSAWGTVVHSRQEALALAFPDAERIEQRLFTLTEEQVKQAASRASVPVESKQVSLYVGHKSEEVLGYAFLDTRNVRTLPGTFLVVITPAGMVRTVMVLAFHEPEDYLPPERWLQQFEEKSLGPDIQLHHGVHGIIGATLSSQAVTNAVRLSLALFQILIQEKQ